MSTSSLTQISSCFCIIVTLSLVGLKVVAACMYSLILIQGLELKFICQPIDR